MNRAADVCLVTTTCGSQQDACDLARLLLDARLVACAQIETIRSLYRWQGEIRDEPEWRLTCKTARAAWPQVEAAIRAAHKYDAPEILALDAAAVHGPYRDWIFANVDGVKSSEP